MSYTIAEYCIQRLQELGIDTLFGIPAVTCAGVFEAAEARNLSIVVTGSDLEAGYAADGYARVRGLGVVSVSYGVGTLSLINAIAGAFVETSPILVLNGGPSASNVWNQKRYGVLYSHSIGRDDTDYHLFKQVVSLALSVKSPLEATYLIDEAITHCFLNQKPVYLEIPKEMLYTSCLPPSKPLNLTRMPIGTESTIANKVYDELKQSTSSALLLGEDIQRYRLQAKTWELIEKLGLPWVTTLLGKSVLDERLPLFKGVYENARTAKPARDVLDKADFILALGCGFATGHTTLVSKSFDKMAHFHDGWFRFKNEPPVRVDFGTFLSELMSLFSSDKSSCITSQPSKSTSSFSPSPDTTALTHDGLFKSVDRFLDETCLVVVDTGLATFLAADLNTAGESAFISNGLWASIGYSVGAGLGASIGGERRPLIICGDGGFQMTAQALSTMARYASSCIVVLIDNGLYAIEQYLVDPRFFSNPIQEPLPYVKLPHWQYHKLSKAMGISSTAVAKTIGEFETALQTAKNHNGPSVIIASIDERDLPTKLR